jgi:hypothetical protein
VRETSSAADGNIVLMTGNWDAEFSIDGGQHRRQHQYLIMTTNVPDAGQSD